MTAVDLDAYLLTFTAACAVACPHCHAEPGRPCQSTGGGNGRAVVTHRARERRVEGFTAAQVAEAEALLAQVRHLPWPYEGMAERFAAFEAAATPVPAKDTRQSTPRGVRLSEAQAERIEAAAEFGGRYEVSLAHFHGDAADRQSVNALEAKGILREAARPSHGYWRVMKLTAFGWQVYRQHRLIIRRLPDQDVAAAEAAALPGGGS